MLDKLLNLDFVRQAFVYELKGQTFVFISLVGKPSLASCESAIIAIFPEVELIILHALPVDESGEVDSQALLASTCLVTARQVKQLIMQRLNLQEDFQITRRQQLGFFNKQLNSVLPQDAKTQLASEGLAANKKAYAKGKVCGELKPLPANLLLALVQTATHSPNKGITYINESGAARFTSYQDLLSAAMRMAACLKAQKIMPGDNLILSLGEHDVFFKSLWAAIVCQATPASITLANDLQQVNADTEKLYRLWQLLGKPKIITTKDRQQDFQQLKRLYPDFAMQLIFYEDLLLKMTADVDCLGLPEIAADSPVFYQLTSGSTGLPKCIIEKHQNIIAHVKYSAAFNNYTADDISLNWISVDHVVPIITCHFRDVTLACQQLHVASAYIINQPVRWFELIEQYQVSLTWAPNFAYKLLANAASELQADDFDLTTMRYFMNAGEQVTSVVMQDFIQALEKFSLPSTVVQPAFGMAEVATCMTYQNQFSMQTSVLKVKQVQHQQGLVLSAEENAHEFISLGPPVAACEIRILDKQGNLEPELKIGALQIRGEMLSGGYYKNDQANLAFADDGWFDTGDLAFIYRGELYIAGREKETIIIRGQNFFCYDIEDVVNKIHGVLPTFVAATSFYDDAKGTEQLLIFIVLNDVVKVRFFDLISDIKLEVAKNFNLQASVIIDISQKGFPKTSSGKIQRNLLKQQFLSGKFDYRLNRADLLTRSVVYVKQWIRQKCQSYEVITDESGVVIFSDLYLKPLNSLAENVLLVTDFLKNFSSNNSQVKKIVFMVKQVVKIIDQDAHDGYQFAWLFGLLNSLKKELMLPDLVVLDFSGADPQQDFALLKKEVHAGLKDAIVAYRQSERFVQRLVPKSLPAKKTDFFKLKKRYLLVGGRGGIGLSLATYLQRHYQAELVLTGTDNRAPAGFEYFQLDLLRDFTQNEVLLNILAKVDGVIYLAGTMPHCLAKDFDAQIIQQSLTLKSASLQALFECAYRINPKIKFITFSSVASFLGAAEYSLYAAANSLLEASCEFMQHQYDADISCYAWAPWLNLGMSKQFNYQELQHALDFITLIPEQAIAMLEQALQSSEHQALIGLNPQSSAVLGCLNQVFPDYFELRFAEELTVAQHARLNAMELLASDGQSVKWLISHSSQQQMDSGATSDIVEVCLEKIWSKHLELDSFDKKQNFFALGGDSLSAIAVIMDIADCFTKRLTVADLVNAKDFYQLLALLYGGENNEVEGYKKYIDSSCYPLSLDQQRLLYLCQLGQNLAYNVYKGYQISGVFEREVFEKAVAALMQQFPVLSTQFFYGDKEIVQTTISFAIDEVYQFQEISELGELKEAINRCICTPFTLLSKHPLFHVRLFSLAGEKYYLLLNIHHLLLDEWSLALLIQFISKQYNKALARPPISRSKGNNYFPQFVLQQQFEQHSFSKNFIDSIQPPYELFSLTQTRAYRGGMLNRAIDQKVHAKLQKLAQLYALTPATLYHALFALVLVDYSACANFNMAIPITYRQNAAYRDTFGLLVNTSLIGIQWHPEDTLLKFVNRVAGSYLLAQLNHQVPFSKLRETLKDAYHENLYQTVFVYEAYTANWRIKRLKIEEDLTIHNGTAKFILTAAVKFPQQHTPVLSVEYDKSVIDEQLAKQLLDKFKQFVECCAQLDQLSISTADFLAEVDCALAI